jgi:ABC-2 type transport system ATP-binding protein
MIELQQLTKHFGELVAVDHVTLTIPRGEFFAVLGPNAAGKTTTIRIVAGLMKPTSGRARVAGFDVQVEPIEARRRMAYVPDFPFLYDKLTPWEFLRFTGQLFRMEEGRIESAARGWAARFNLGEYLNTAIESLSHGTRQRVALASAMMHDPEVIVLDEPMVGLDPHHARVLKDILKELADRGATIFVSTHQLSVAEEMADRIGIMHHGRMIAVGSREELRQRSGQDGALEQTFLALTAEEADLAAAGKKLRSVELRAMTTGDGRSLPGSP